MARLYIQKLLKEYEYEEKNMPENTWINYSDYATDLSMPWYSYNNIIILINVTILEFLSAHKNNQS